MANVWKEDWLMKEVDIEYCGEQQAHRLGEYLKKSDKEGSAECTLCNTVIRYSGRGVATLKDHCKRNTHINKLPKVKNVQTLDRHGFITPDSAGNVIDTDERPAMMCDRVSTQEAQILSFLCEESLPLSKAPKLLELARSLAKDPKALKEVKLGRETVGYKLTHGLAKHKKDNLVEKLKVYPFSMNVDECTSQSHKKVLSVLVSFYDRVERKIRVEHLQSIEILVVNALTIYTALIDLFRNNNLPYNNCVSSLFDSCNTMRGIKNGVETLLRKEIPHLNDVDGDTCHHIHNACKKFTAPFDKWLENLFSDLYNDAKWASDMRSFLSEICEFMSIPFSSPEMYTPQRWISVYECVVAMMAKLPAIMVLYYGGMSQSDRDIYADVFKPLVENLNEKQLERIEKIHSLVRKKGRTKDGQERLKRITAKIFTNNHKTVMQMNFYVANLWILQEYVLVFQGKQFLVHKLHPNQIEVILKFLAHFVKPLVLNEADTPKKIARLANAIALPVKSSIPGTKGLKQEKTSPIALPVKSSIPGTKGLKQEKTSIRKKNPNVVMSSKEMFYGARNVTFMKTLPADDINIKEFQDQACQAYIQCSLSMLTKLPVNNEFLQILVALDPLERPKSKERLSKLVTDYHFDRFLTGSEIVDYQSELVYYQSDRKLPSFDSDDDMVKWWSQVDDTHRYGALMKVVFAALSIFHGPLVEGSFSVMNDIMDKQANRMDAKLYSAYATVRYDLSSKSAGEQSTSVKLYDRPDVKYSPIDKDLCISMRGARSSFNRENKQKGEEDSVRKQYYGIPRNRPRLTKKKAKQTEEDKQKSGREYFLRLCYRKHKTKQRAELLRIMRLRKHKTKKSTRSSATPVKREDEMKELLKQRQAKQKKIANEENKKKEELKRKMDILERIAPKPSTSKKQKTMMEFFPK